MIFLCHVSFNITRIGMVKYIRQQPHLDENVSTEGDSLVFNSQQGNPHTTGQLAPKH